MTSVQVVTGDFEQSIPQLLRGATVVALVPATELRGWAAEMAWHVARAAASEGRRVALVDCFVDAPSLHSITGAVNNEGLVDAFEYGASLTKIVQRQPQAGLYFIPAGTYSADAEPLMQNPRWRRLSAGFRHEEALLLLYVGAEHLPSLAAEPDGLVVLAPQGLDLAVADTNPALTAAVGHGTPVLAVIADEDKLAPGALAPVPPPVVRFELAAADDEAPVDAPATGDMGEAAGEVSAGSGEPAELEPSIAGDRLSLPFEPLRRRGSAPMAFLVEQRAGKPKWPFVVAGTGLAAAAVLVWYSVTQSRVEAEPPAADTAVAAQPVAAQPIPPVESLPWTVPVASLPSLAEALALADSLEQRHVPAIVSPVRVRGRATFRVHAGPFTSRSSADSELAQVRASRFASGGPDSMPLSVALAGGMTRAQAFSERARLRQAGVPTFILGQDSGTFRLYAGAYDASAQAALLTDILTPTGGAGTLVPRSGYVP